MQGKRFLSYCLGSLGIYLGMILPVMALPVQALALPGLNKADEHRQVVDAYYEPWQIIGRVQTELGGKCTGFLIHPDIVVTAAHCLWIKKTAHFIEPHSVHFLWNYQRQTYREAFLVKRFILSPVYHGTLTGSESPEQMAQDWAFLLVSGKPVKRTALLPIDQTLPSIGSIVSLAGYEQDRKEVLYADHSCRITRIVPIAEKRFLFFHDCQGTFGSSGAPLMRRNNQGKWKIIGIQVVAFTERAGGIAISIPVQK